MLPRGRWSKGDWEKDIPMRLLHKLLERIHPALSLSAIPNLEINGVRDDSRLVTSGDLFIARKGTQADGAQFITDAKNRGAIAVVTETEIAGLSIPQIVVGDAGVAASILAHAFHDHPSENIEVLGITGTNGKTTVAYLLRHVLGKLKQRCGMIGTVETDDGRLRHESTLTTPGAIEVAELMAKMRDNGCRACAIETSSHSLDQGRVAGVKFAGAAFTNLTGDHQDYHKTMDAYAAAKAKLFEMLPAESVAVVNAEDQWTGRMIRDCSARIIRFGFGECADYRARDISITTGGSEFLLETPGGNEHINIRLIGKHNVENTLAAAALLGEVFGFSISQLAAGLKEAAGAPGRLQAVRAGQPFAVLVDYAHTDDALRNVLTTLRPLTSGRLRVLFGCGGDRDRDKRPRMAQVAERFADDVYLTSDNPRTEDPQIILDDTAAGFSSRNAIHIFLDRRRAIENVLSDAKANDVVLLAGKGHENYQIIGATKHHFDDVEECMRVLAGKSVAA
jgi:UDP-N-acetylmuramoyl-L-alanyl-D-glutamate--2,6-diaminopimelate ligase